MVVGDAERLAGDRHQQGLIVAALALRQEGCLDCDNGALLLARDAKREVVNEVCSALVELGQPPRRLLQQDAAVEHDGRIGRLLEH